MLAIDLSLNEAADQIGVWIGRTLVIDLLKVSADGFGASLDLCKAVDTIGGAVASSEKIVNQVIEINPQGNVDAQHLGDHTDRQQQIGREACRDRGGKNGKNTEGRGELT